jgi:signal transduction histidine kinase
MRGDGVCEQIINSGGIQTSRATDANRLKHSTAPLFLRKTQRVCKQCKIGHALSIRALENSYNRRMRLRIWNNRSYPKSQLLVAAALLLLLPLLAMMQYRLLEKVSEGERERMRASLAAAASRFSLDFDLEIIRIYSSFLTAQPVPSESKPELTSVSGTKSDGTVALIVSAGNRWREATAYPRLIEAVFLVRLNESGERELTRINLETGMAKPEEWPAEMTGLKGMLPARDTGNVSRRDNGVGAGSLLPVTSLDDGKPALLFQVAEVTPGPPGLPGIAGTAGRGNDRERTGQLGIVVATINLQYLQQELLPAMVRHHFVEGDRQHFDMAIATPAGGGEAIWRSDATGSSAPPSWKFAESDLSVQFFNIRSELLRQQLRRWRPSTEPQMPPPGTLRLATVGGRRLFSDEVPPLWDLYLRHYSGSLDVAVTNARRTNLMISLAVLFLLTASFMLMMVSSVRARRLAQEQMNFVAGISHELRTPLAVIDSAGYNLSRGFVKRPEAMQEYGEMIRTECRRLGEMVEQVLDFATFRSGRQVFDHQPLALSDIIDESLRASQPLLEGGGFRIEQQVPETLPGGHEYPMVLADRQAMIRALRNLLSNAMKYGGDDRWIGLRVNVTRRGRQEMVNLTISDHGRGIAREDLSHIFEPFYRSSDVRTAQIQGNGLGLSLVRNIVEAHHGTIHVESQVGRGSSFTISLPAAGPAAGLAAGLAIEPVADSLTGSITGPAASPGQLHY